ncbi:MAG TPA: hypothetical protein VM513_15005 [Kofleriaceae bacterium]|jgi:hypothetical protein|nr:hypothetical protein [Kofleriaceae bacterium]
MPALADRDWFPRTLRAIATVVLVLCAIAAVAGVVPGVQVYKDTNDCIGEALGNLFVMHHGGHAQPCESNPVLIGTEAAGGWSFLVALLPIALGAWIVRRHPTYLAAFLWPVLLLVAFAVWFVATFDLDLFSPIHRVPMWPAYALQTVLGAIALMLAVVMIGVPIVALVRAIRRPRAPRPEPLAAARVVKRP